jgi:hypothetical protein
VFLTRLTLGPALRRPSGGQTTRAVASPSGELPERWHGGLSTADDQTGLRSSTLLRRWESVVHRNPPRSADLNAFVERFQGRSFTGTSATPSGTASTPLQATSIRLRTRDREAGGDVDALEPTVRRACTELVWRSSPRSRLRGWFGRAVSFRVGRSMRPGERDPVPATARRGWTSAALCQATRVRGVTLSSLPAASS